MFELTIETIVELYELKINTLPVPYQFHLFAWFNNYDKYLYILKWLIIDILHGRANMLFLLFVRYLGSQSWSLRS